MDFIHPFSLFFFLILENQQITFVCGFVSVSVSFKPTLIALDDTTGNVYAAGSIYLAHLSSNLTLINQIQPNSTDCENCQIRVLEIDYGARKLLVCGISDKGSCTYHNLDNIFNFSLLSSQHDIDGAIGRNGSVVALFLPSSDKNSGELVMGISQPQENQVDLLSFRTISSGHLTYLNRSGGSHHLLRILNEFRKDVKVHFVYGFQHKDGLYFLVNKSGINGTSSWLFRICSKEKSVYPFIAIPLSCYEEKEPITYNLAIAANFYDHSSGKSLIVSFGYNSNKETHVPNAEFGSSVCRFELTKIIKDMEFVKQGCRSEPYVSVPGWIMGSTLNCFNDSTRSLCENYVNQALEISFKLTPTHIVKIFERELITSVIPFFIDDQLHILTNNGDLYHYKKSMFQEYPVHKYENIKGLRADVEIDKRNKTAYAITDNKIVKISLDLCTRYLNCSKCVLSSLLKCVWFNGQCCGSDRNTGGLENTCPPEITNIEPDHGVTLRRNLITIHGNYLGTIGTENRSVLVCQKPCLVNVTRSNPSKIVCKTERISLEQQCAITVNISDTKGSPHMKGEANNFKHYFHLKSVSITGFDPELGPESGGTNITVIGNNMNLTSTVVIDIENLSLPCNVISFNETYLICTTQPFKQSRLGGNTNESIGCGRILFKMENDVIAESNGTFCYWKDPQITNIYPRRSIKSGGLDVNVEGTNLNVIANPRLGITLNNSERQPETEECEAKSSTTMICTTPKLTTLVPNDTSVNGDIYFVMDGVKELKEFAKYYPNLSDFKINQDPEFSYIPESSSLEKSISIKGKNIKESEVLNQDIQVTITSDAGTNIRCPVIKLGEEAVSCQPKLISDVNETHFVVQVKVGNRYYKVGNIFVNKQGTRTPNEPYFPQKITQYAIIVGVASAVLICIILIACIIWCVCRQKKNDKMRHMFIEMSESAADSHLIISGVQQVKRLMDASTIMNIEEANLFINREKLTIGEVIGAGNFGCVCEGFLIEENDMELKVAVKTLQDTNAGEINLKEFVEEALLMKDFEHPNVLRLIGITLSKDSSPLVILPFMGNGDLLKYVSDEEKKITLNQLIMFAMDISRGMEYLGALKFVHRDLAARNCMLDDHFNVKVADFGLTRDIYEKGYYHSENKKTKLPIRWMAIESIERGTYSSKSDVWSFAVVIWELLTRGVTPYPGVEGWDVIAYLRSGRRLRKPWFCDANLYSLMLTCWDKDIVARPDFTEVTEELDNILHDYETISSSYGTTTDTFGKSVPAPPVLVTIPECYNYYESLSPIRDQPQQYFVLETLPPT